MKTRVCVCIPTYKRPLGLTRLLRELPGLTGDFEIHVVVADNDAEGTEGLTAAREIATTGYPLPLTAIAVSERGIAQTRNALVETAIAAADPEVHLHARRRFLAGPKLARGSPRSPRRDRGRHGQRNYCPPL